MLSPVILASSIEALPSITFPSTGTKSPFFTITISLTLTSLASITTSSLFFSTLAVLGASPINLVIALVVFFFDKLSKYLPKLTNVKIIPADSKYKLCLYSSTNPKSPLFNPWVILIIAKIP